MGWNKIRLSELCSMRTGKLDSNAAVKNGEYPFFTCAQETLQIDTPAFDTEAVLLGGNNAAGIFPLKYYKGQFNAYQRTYVIESIDKKALSTRFLYFALRPALSHFQSVSIGAATQYLTKTILDNFKIPLPPIEIQQRIGNLLGAYDDLIENNRRRIQLLEQSARLLYKEWFVRLRFPGHERVKIKDGVPEGWERKPLSAICYEIRDAVRPDQVEPNTPYIGLEHIPRRSITLNQWGCAEDVESTKFRFAEGDILFGKIRPYFHKVGIALTEGITSSDSIVIRATDKRVAPYCLALVSSDQFVAVASKTAKEGSKMPRADWKFMEQHPVLLPANSLLFGFNQFFGDILKQLKVLALQGKKLSNSRDLLLPRLMNGEISV